MNTDDNRRWRAGSDGWAAVRLAEPAARSGSSLIHDTVTVMVKTAAQAPPQPIEIPRRLGNVKLGDVIGRGATGVVLSGFDEILNRRVAVKILSRVSVAAGQEELARFVEGVRSAAAVKHAHVVTVHAVDTVAGMPYIVMEHVDGVSLRDLLKHAGKLDLPLALLAISAVAGGVEALHAGHIVHRDIKPANVMFDYEGETHLCDFGLACQLGADSQVRGDAGVSGTPLYMAPEVFEGVVSPQSDVYALGAMLFEMLAGAGPFQADSMDAMRACHAESPVPLARLARNGVPDDVAEVIERALHKTRIMRYKTAGHFLRALEQTETASRDVSPPRQSDQLRMRLAGMVAGLGGSPDSAPRGAAGGGAETMFDLVARRARQKRGLGDS